MEKKQKLILIGAAAVTLLLIGITRVNGHRAPELLADLNRSQNQETELTRRLQQRFPEGSDEEKLQAYLQAEGFEMTQGDNGTRRSTIALHGSDCTDNWQITWEANAKGEIFAYDTDHQHQCR